jgi:hypothetical protein
MISILILTALFRGQASDESMDQSIRLMSYLNRERGRVGLPPATINPVLIAAAERHSNYNVLNQAYDHVENPSSPGFTGVDPNERAKAAGFENDVVEGISSDVADRFIRRHIGLIYHRWPILQPGNIEFGFARSQDHWEKGGKGQPSVMVSSVPHVRGVVAFPGPNQRLVPLTMGRGEAPNPLSFVHGDYPAGFPITVFFYEYEPVTRAEATLTDSAGVVIPTYVLTPSKDWPLPKGVAIVPKQGLIPLHNYHCAATITLRNGKQWTQDWKFRTGPVYDQPSGLTHFRNGDIDANFCQYCRQTAQGGWELYVAAQNTGPTPLGKITATVQDGRRNRTIRIPMRGGRTWGYAVFSLTVRPTEVQFSLAGQTKLQKTVSVTYD